MYRKRRAIQRMLAFHHFAFSVYQHQVRNANLAEVHAKRIHPEMIQPLRITRRDVPGNPSSKPNFENKRNEAASRSFRCRRSSSAVANSKGPGAQHSLPAQYHVYLRETEALFA